MDSKIDELRKKMIGAAKKKVQERYDEKDVHITKSVNILDDIDPIANLLIEQVREWHAVHFPELADIVSEAKPYLKLVSGIGLREKFTEKSVEEYVEDAEIAAKIVAAAKNSMGSEITEKDLGGMKTLALNCINLLEEREYLAKYLEETMTHEMPNFTQVAGPVIGAKILAKAGGKKKLAFLSSSAIQVIGAEKAMFMHFKKGVKGPKYGYLYNHPLVKSAAREDKGRIARMIASKLSIAAKIDYFRGKLDPTLMESVEQRAKEFHGAARKPTRETNVSELMKEKYKNKEGRPEWNIDKREGGARKFGGYGASRGFGSDRRERSGGFSRPFRSEGREHNRSERKEFSFDKHPQTERKEFDAGMPAHREGFGRNFRIGAPRSGGFGRDNFKPRSGGRNFAPRGEGFKPRGEGFAPRRDGFAPRRDGGASRGFGGRRKGNFRSDERIEFNPDGPTKRGGGGFSRGRKPFHGGGFRKKRQ